MVFNSEGAFRNSVVVTPDLVLPVSPQASDFAQLRAAWQAVT